MSKLQSLSIWLALPFVAGFVGLLAAKLGMHVISSQPQPVLVALLGPISLMIGLFGKTTESRIVSIIMAITAIAYPFLS